MYHRVIVYGALSLMVLFGAHYRLKQQKKNLQLAPKQACSVPGLIENGWIHPNHLPDVFQGRCSDIFVAVVLDQTKEFAKVIVTDVD